MNKNTKAIRILGENGEEWFRKSDIRKKVNLLREELNKDMPAALSVLSYVVKRRPFTTKDYYLPLDGGSIFLKERLKLDNDIISNPDEYIRPYDVVKRKIREKNTQIKLPAYHFAVYLGDKRVVHVFRENEEMRATVDS